MTFRAFIAADIGVVPELVGLAEEIKSTGCHVKLVEPENVHITLKFLGDTDEGVIPVIRESMVKSTEGIDPLRITLKGVGVFPKWNFIRVIWVGTEGTEPLKVIARKLDNELKPLGFKPEKKFKAHLTLGRVKSQKGREKLQKVLDDHRDKLFGEFAIDVVRLKKSVLSSKGPTYSTVEEVKLGTEN